VCSDYSGGSDFGLPVLVVLFVCSGIEFGGLGCVFTCLFRVFYRVVFGGWCFRFALLGGLSL